MNEVVTKNEVHTNWYGQRRSRFRVNEQAHEWVEKENGEIE